jgi:hypothetical protein
MPYFVLNSNDSQRRKIGLYNGPTPGSGSRVTLPRFNGTALLYYPFTFLPVESMEDVQFQDFPATIVRKFPLGQPLVDALLTAGINITQVIEHDENNNNNGHGMSVQKVSFVCRVDDPFRPLCGDKEKFTRQNDTDFDMSEVGQSIRVLYPDEPLYPRNNSVGENILSFLENRPIFSTLQNPQNFYRPLPLPDMSQIGLFVPFAIKPPAAMGTALSPFYAVLDTDQMPLPYFLYVPIKLSPAINGTVNLNTVIYFVSHFRLRNQI